MKYLSVAEAAATLGVSARTVRNRITRGELRADRVGARVLLIPEREIAKQPHGKLKTGPKAGRKRPARRDAARKENGS